MPERRGAYRFFPIARIFHKIRGNDGAHTAEKLFRKGFFFRIAHPFAPFDIRVERVMKVQIDAHVALALVRDVTPVDERPVYVSRTALFREVLRKVAHIALCRVKRPGKILSVARHAEKFQGRAHPLQGVGGKIADAARTQPRDAAVFRSALRRLHQTAADHAHIAERGVADLDARADDVARPFAAFAGGIVHERVLRARTESFGADAPDLIEKLVAALERAARRAEIGALQKFTERTRILSASPKI